MKSQLNHKERVGLFHTVLGVGKGLDCLDEIQRLFGVGADTFHPDPRQDAYHSGQKAAAIKIKQIVFDDPERVVETKEE